MKYAGVGNVLVHPAGKIILRQFAARLIIGASVRLDALQITGNDMLAFSYTIDRSTSGALEVYIAECRRENVAGLPSWSSGKLPRSGLSIENHVSNAVCSDIITFLGSYKLSCCEGNACAKIPDWGKTHGEGL
jgi:hypothetical protein